MIILACFIHLVVVQITYFNVLFHIYTRFLGSLVILSLSSFFTPSTRRRGEREEEQKEKRVHDNRLICLKWNNKVCYGNITFVMKSNYNALVCSMGRCAYGSLTLSFSLNGWNNGDIFFFCSFLLTRSVTLFPSSVINLKYWNSCDSALVVRFPLHHFDKFDSIKAILHEYFLICLIINRGSVPVWNVFFFSSQNYFSHHHLLSFFFCDRIFFFKYHTYHPNQWQITIN